MEKSEPLVAAQAAAPPAAPAPPPADAILEPANVCAPPPDEAPASSTPGPKRLGKFELLDKLRHQGAMGVVYKAFHPDLKAYFVVKVLPPWREQSESAVARFRREAEAAARLRHPGVVSVVDFGREGDQPYLAMEYVEGTDLARVLDDPEQVGIERAPLPRSGSGLPAVTAAGRPFRAWGLPPRTAARLLREIAEALEAAHAAGVLHRDLKPENVMRDRAGRLKLMDFGLAKLLDEGDVGLSREGSGMGTPAYESPEQAAGRWRELDERSDVYSLGAVLYELLTGRPPYDGATALDITVKVVGEEDPVPPRRLNPRIDRDIETICLKAMAREKAARYASARALAEDCARYLDGDPIQARPVGRALRLWKVLRKHWGLVVPVALALLVASGALGWGWQERLHRAAKTREWLDRIAVQVDRFQDDVMRIEMSSEARSAHARQSLTLLEDCIKDEPGLGPAYSWRGRVRALLQEGVEAQRDFDRGCVLSPRSAVAWYLRAMDRLANYEAARGLPGEEWSSGEGLHLAPMPPETPAERELKIGGLADLDRVENCAAGDPLLRPEDLHLARAMVLLHAPGTGRYEAALREIAGVDRPPAWKVKGVALYFLARFDDAALVFAQLVKTWPCDEEAWRMLGDAHHAIGVVGAPRGLDARAGLRKAIAAYDMSLQLVPKDRHALVRRAEAYRDLGEAEAAHGGDPRDCYRKAIADCGEALRRDSQGAGAHNGRGNAYWRLADAEAARGLDPRASLTRAIADFDAALGRDPAMAVFYTNRGNAYYSLGRAQGEHGQDPRESYRKAIADCNEALRCDPSFALAYRNRADAYGRLGAAEAERGLDPGDCFRRSLADFGAALERNSNYAEAYSNRSCTYQRIGMADAAAGHDPCESYRHAIADCTEALRCNPEYADAYCNRGRAYHSLGTAEQARGEDPRASFKSAIADCSEALRRKANDANALNNRGTAYLSLGQAEASRNKDPRECYRSAIADYEAAMRINADEAVAFNGRGGAYVALGVAEAALQLDPGESFAKAEADLKAAIRKNYPPAYFNLGLLYELTGRLDEAIRAFEIRAKALPAHAGEATKEIEKIKRLGAERAAQGRADSDSAVSADPTIDPGRRELAIAQKALVATDYAAARPHYERGLAILEEALAKFPEGERDRRLAERPLRIAIVNAHYNLACILSLAAVGRDGPKAEAKAVDPAAAAQLRDCAFAHLGAVERLGWTEQMHLEADSDLAALHDDPRWGPLLNRVRPPPK